MNRLGLYLSIVALTLFAIGVGGLNLLYRLRVKPGIDSQIAMQDRYKSLYEEDEDFLHKNLGRLSIGKSAGISDAGAYLNSKVLWVPTKSKSRAIVDEATRVALLRTGADWIVQIAKSRRPTVDLTFFNELSKFDYWDIENESPIGELITQKTFVPPIYLPIPDTSDLIAAVKLRLIAGGLDHDFTTALQDVRALGGLLLTTENTQLLLAGLLVLDFERRAYRYYVDNLKMDARVWSPVDANVTRRARRAIIASRAYLRLWTPARTLQEIFVDRPPPPGLCGVMNEALPFEYSLRPILEPHWPFEMDTRTEFSLLDRVLLRAQSQCRLRYLTMLKARGSFKVKVPGPLLLTDLPYSRKIFGLRLSSAELGGFEAYGRQVGGEQPAAD